MKFVMIRDYNHDLSKDKVIIGKIRKTYMEGYESVTLAYLKRIEDFNENDKYIIIRNTESIQIRPKAIYRNNKGYYILEDNKEKILPNEYNGNYNVLIQKCKIFDSIVYIVRPEVNNVKGRNTPFKYIRNCIRQKFKENI